MSTTGWRQEVLHTRKGIRVVREPAGALKCPQLIALLPLCSMDRLRDLLDGKSSDMVNSIRIDKCEDLEGHETYALRGGCKLCAADPGLLQKSIDQSVSRGVLSLSC